MVNEIKLQEGHPIDENLRPLKVGGKSTSIELAQMDAGARVSGGLEVKGGYINLTSSSGKDIALDPGGDIILDGDVTIIGDIDFTGGPQNITADEGLNIVATGITIDSSTAIELDAASGDVYVTKGGIVSGLFVAFDVDAKTYKQYYDLSNYLTIQTGANGATTISTVDNDGAVGHLTLDVDGDIILDPASGNFIAKNAGTEFSAANSAYAGMMLGLTHVFGSGTNGVFQSVATAWESLLWDTDKYALVTFVVPPSNKVKISVFLPYVQLAGQILQLGLATDSSATTLNTKYQNNAWDVDETDTIAINYSWVVEGSDHSWSAGETKTLYIMAYADAAIRMYTGGTSGDKYGGVIVEATALPATIGDGSEP